MDLPDYDKSIDQDLHVKIGDKGYAYAQLSPGKHRIVSLMDFGCHQEAFIDPERANHVKSNYYNDFYITPSDPNQPDVKNLRTCLRPQSCDDLPIIGQLSYYPNVVLNAGHGGHGTSISFACAKMV